MSSKEFKANSLLLLTAFIWGLAFVAQRKGAEHLGALSFNGIRFIIGSISLVPLILYRKRYEGKEKCDGYNEERKKIIRLEIKYGVATGIVLFTAATLQQAGVAMTTAGKAGFITGLYMVIVPILGIPLKQKTSFNNWIGVVVGVVGLYLLSINEGFSISKGDLLVLIGSFFWAVHILLIDNFTKKVDSIRLSSIQFAVCGILSFVASLIFEDMSVNAVAASAVPILYGGLLSVGVAYTLQAVAQKNVKPSHAAILLSMESVFAFLGGAVILREALTAKEITGCIMILSAIIITQLKPLNLKKKVNSGSK